MSLVYDYPHFSLFFCTPEDLADDEVELQACCGDGQDIPLPITPGN